ncbi:MAG: molybdenum cofactor guanylyltransferase [Actinomycetota bacterium]
MDGATSGVGAVVLAGGRSRRMGTDKATVSFCGRRMIDVVVERLRALTDEVVVCARERSALEPILVPVVEDEEAYAGPLPALVAGIRAAGTQRVVAVACDMPFLNVPLLADLAGRLTDDIDAVVPVTLDGPQPLHAAYGDCAIEPLLATLAAGERSLRGALSRLRVRWVEEEEWRALDTSGTSFRNVNTPDELAEAAALGI